MSPTSYRQPGTVLTDHVLTVPLDHSEPAGEQIEVFAREVTAAGSASAGLPWLVFLQGGPGFPAQRPVGRDGWLDRALRDYRVLLLDQRGTGRSAPATRQTLPARGGPAAQARYLSHFRADSIVADAEVFRRRVAGGAPWTVLGQSFGGFCAMTYLSQAPGGVAEALICGGLPGLTATADEVYQQTFPVVAARNFEHYARYPGDADIARTIARKLLASPDRLPSGGLLTAEGFQSLGLMLGMSTGSHRLHYLLEGALAGDELSDSFRYQAQELLSFWSGPLYGLLHEPAYAQGAATRWAAQRVRGRFPEFDPARAADGDGPLLFTGEMIFPWMFETDPVLAPLAQAAEELAARADWPALYDPARLAAGTGPAAAAVYYRDMYVPAGLSLATAAATGGLIPWVTSEWEHDGLRVSGGVVLDRLIGLVRGEA